MEEHFDLDLDLDRAFDKIVSFESESVRKGLEAGKIEAANRAKGQGFKLGLEKGFELGSEVGFYLGFAESCGNLTPAELSPKAEKAARRLIEIGGNIPEENIPENGQDFGGKLQEMRAKFKQLCSLLKVKLDFDPEAESKVTNW